MNQKKYLTMAQHRSGKNQVSGRRSGRNTGGAECFQHRLCVYFAAHHQHGRGRARGRFLVGAGAAGRRDPAGQIMFGATGRFLSEYTSAAVVENRFKHRLFSALLTGDYASVAAVHSGEWMNRLTSDTTVVAGGVTQIVPGLIGMLVRLFGRSDRHLWLEPRFFWC